MPLKPKSLVRVTTSTTLICPHCESDTEIPLDHQKPGEWSAPCFCWDCGVGFEFFHEGTAIEVRIVKPWQLMSGHLSHDEFSVLLDQSIEVLRKLRDEGLNFAWTAERQARSIRAFPKSYPTGESGPLPERFEAESRYEMPGFDRNIVWVNSRYEGVSRIDRFRDAVIARYGIESVSDIKFYEVQFNPHYFDCIPGIDWKQILRDVTGPCCSGSSSSSESSSSLLD